MSDDATPTVWSSGDLDLPLSYRFDPGAQDDGVTVHVPVDVLARLGGADFGWQVPALREELVIALLRSLPKDRRRALVPIPDTARAVLAELTPGAEPLLHGLQRELHRRNGELIPLDAFDLDKLPPHLRVTFAVEDAEGVELARSKDLNALQRELAREVQAAVVAGVADELSVGGLTAWPDRDEVPHRVEREQSGHLVQGWPAFVDDGPSVSLQVFATEAEQQAAMPAGVRRLVRLTVPSPARAVERTLGPRTKLVLAANPDGSLAALIDDCADAAVDALVDARRSPAGLPWTRADFDALAHPGREPAGGRDHRRRRSGRTGADGRP